MPFYTEVFPFSYTVNVFKDCSLDLNIQSDSNPLQSFTIADSWLDISLKCNQLAMFVVIKLENTWEIILMSFHYLK